jgi:hypothetical protein
MTDRVLVLLVAFGIGLVFLALFVWYRKSGGETPERLDIDALGLELMSGCCAFVVFTTPACRPCQAALRVVGVAAERNAAPTEVVTVNAVEHSDLALASSVRTIPTVFLITASGHVVRRWRNVPEIGDVDAALEAL